MENKNLNQPLNTLPQLMELGNKVNEELDIVSVDYLGRYNEIVSSESTKREKIEEIKSLSNSLVKVRTQSELTHQFKDARKKVKEVSDLLKTSESNYIEGIRAIEAQVNEPLTKEKERVEGIENYFKTVETYLLDSTNLVAKGELSVLELENLKEEVKSRLVMPDGIEEGDNYEFSPYSMSLFNNLNVIIDNNIKMAKRIEELEKEVAKEPVVEPEKTVSGLFGDILEDTFKQNHDEEKFKQEYLHKFETEGNFTEYAKKLLHETNPEAQELLADVYSKFQDNQIIGGAIDIDVALSVLVTEINSWIKKRP